MGNLAVLFREVYAVLDLFKAAVRISFAADRQIRKVVLPQSELELVIPFSVFAFQIFDVGC